MEHSNDLLAERVTNEPPLFKGCSLSELMMILTIVTSACTVLGILAAMICRSVLLAPSAILVGTMVGTYLGAIMLTRAKRNRPDDYHVHRFMRQLHRYYLWRSPILWRSGHWDTIRSH